MRVRWVAGLCAVIATSFGATAALAQRPKADSTGTTRLAYGQANILVRADSVDGVHIWANTTQFVRGSRQRDFVGYFSPDEVDRWVTEIDAVLGTEKPWPDDTLPDIRAGLADRFGALAVIARPRQKSRYSKHIFLYLAETGEGAPFIMRGRHKEIAAFREALRVAAARSSVRAIPATSARHVNPMSRYCAMALAGNRQPRYPEALRSRGMTGEVWAMFAVTADGRFEPGSFTAILADHVLFAYAVHEALQEHRFEPARIDGVPVRSQVYQRFIFSLR